MKHPILALTEKPSRLVIGFMSGTSADGIDAALTRIEGYGTDTRVTLLSFLCKPFEPAVRDEILRLAGGGEAAAADFCKMNFLLGELYAEAGEELCRQAGITPEEIDLIGNHGQTLWHIPQKHRYLGHQFSSTLQLGGDAVLAERFSCPVVGDFRVRDMAAGGLGAPLVPYTEYLLYRSETECVALQNLGGIGNITVLPAGCSLNDIVAFDTGPGNMLIDSVVSHYTGGRRTYDPDGMMASWGPVNAELLDYLMRDPYLDVTPPKTTGREYYGPAYMEKLYRYIEDHRISKQELLSTVTRYTAETVAFALRHFSREMPAKLIVGGGGSRNLTVMRHLRELLPGCRVMTQEELGMNGDAKEAVAFAILANEAVFASCGNVPSATGAAHPVVLGRISL